jgi:hypothetical protein
MPWDWRETELDPSTMKPHELQALMDFLNMGQLDALTGANLRRAQNMREQDVADQRFGALRGQYKYDPDYGIDFSYYPAGTMGRMSHAPHDKQFMRTVHWDRPPDPGMMFWSPYNPERWG